MEKKKCKERQSWLIHIKIALYLLFKKKIVFTAALLVASEGGRQPCYTGAPTHMPML